MGDGIWVFVEHKGGKILKVSQEILTEAARLGEALDKPISAVVVGFDLRNLLDSVARFDVSRIYTVDDERLGFYVRDAYRDVLHGLIVKHDPGVFLFPNTTQGTELSSSVAGKMKTALVTNCVGFETDERGGLLLRRSVYGGKLSVRTRAAETRPQMATVVPGYFQVDEREKPVEPEIHEETMDLGAECFVTQVEKEIRGNPKTIDLSEAEIIVAGGSGASGSGGFGLVAELADVLGGSVGASRAAVDKGAAPIQRQIGQTGKSVSPELFISFGISGAIQFTMGMKESQIIIANDINRSAPILKLADVAIVADLNDVIPALIREVKRVKDERNGSSSEHQCMQD